MKTGKTILDLEGSFQSVLEHTLESPTNNPEADALRLLIPDGYHPTVTLRMANGRRKKRNASARTWSPESEEIVIRCVRNTAKDSTNVPSELSVTPYMEDSAASNKTTASPAREKPFPLAATITSHPDSMSQQVRELCSVLAETERAGWSFIALKRFRDDVLAGKNFSWVQSAENRQAVLAKAIEQGAVVTKKILNPRAPQFPTTTIALSRSYSATQTPEQHRYAPVPVKGEPLSATLLRDRGAR